MSLSQKFSQTSRRVCVFGVLTCAILVAPGYGQETPGTVDPATASNAQNPQTIGLNLHLGFHTSLGKGGKSKGYYRVEFRGRQLTERGEAVKPTTIGDPLPAPTLTTGGDTNAFLIKADNAGVNGDGGLFNFLGVQKIPIEGLKQLRGAAQYMGRTDGGETHLAVGLETANYHPLNFLNNRAGDGIGAGITNWLVLGYAQETVSRATTDGGNKNNGLANFRGFIGRGFGWRNSRKLQDSLQTSLVSNIPADKTAFDKAIDRAKINKDSNRASLSERVLLTLDETFNRAPDDASASPLSQIFAVLQGAATEVEKEKARREYAHLAGEAVRLTDIGAADRAVATAPTFQDGKRIYETYRAGVNADRQTLTGLEAIIALLYLRYMPPHAPLTDAEWQDKLRNAVRRQENVADQPSFALWAEASGWYIATGPLDTPSRRFNAITAFTATYWPNPSGDAYSVSIRYENGRERADPTAFRNQIIASVGYAF